MKFTDDIGRIAALATKQRGVFSTSDLSVALADPHPAAFSRRIQSLIEAGTLRRFLRGWYVAEDFDLATLSQRLAPDSAVSFGNVLAENLMIGSMPSRQVMAVKVGRSRRFRSLGYDITHLGLAKGLHFGFEPETRDGVRWVDREKAVLDVLYFHLRGQVYFFDPYSDIDFSRLDRARLDDYLSAYKNPKFVTFVTKVVDER